MLGSFLTKSQLNASHEKERSVQTQPNVSRQKEGLGQNVHSLDKNNTKFSEFEKISCYFFDMIFSLFQRGNLVD